MQTQKSQEIRNVLQNPVDPEPMLTCLLWATPSGFNQAKSLFGVKKSLHRFTQFTRACPPMSYSRRSVDPPARSPVQPSVRPSGVCLPTCPSVLQPVRPPSPLSPSPILWIRQPIRPPARPSGRPAGQPSARPSVGQSASQSVNPPLPLSLPYLPEAQVNGDALLCIDVVDAGRILCKKDIRGSSSQHPPLPVEVI